MKQVFLSLGSNLGDRTKFLQEAVALLGQLQKTEVVKESGIYETEPWGNTDQPRFLNMAVALETDLSPEELLEKTLLIENLLGRTREDHWGPRTIDIDLLVYEGETRDTEFLTLPHPYMLERKFVLEPLAEIAPNLRVNGKSIAEYWTNIKKMETEE